MDAPAGPLMTSGFEPRAADVSALLAPRSIAIVGATPRVETLGGRPIVNLRTQGFAGTIYPVNPRYQEILGWRCYPDLLALPEPPDVVLVLVGAERIFPTLDQAAEIGARVALVFSAGFAEIEGEGIERQRRLRSYRERGLRICGPNCNGVFSVQNRVAMGFQPSFEFPARRGGIALISQSGNISTCVSSRGMELGVGFSHIVASGNEADLEIADFVEYLLDDPETRVFSLFVEGLKDPPRFLRLAEEALRRGKPIIAMKMGRSDLSQRVALSHTGSMTGSYDVLVGALRQKGVVVAEGLDELYGTAALMASGRRLRGGGLAVASLSGGMAGVVADHCDLQAVPLARFAEATETELAAALPGVANLANPLDVTGQVVNQPEVWRRCLDALVADPDVGALGCILSITAGQIERRFAEDFVAVARTIEQPAFCIWPSSMPAGSGMEVLRESGVPVFLRSRDAIGAFASWRHYWQTREARLAALDGTEPAPAPVPAAARPASGWALLEAEGIRVARQRLVRDEAELDAALAALALPVALKVESAAIAHKTEAGALRLGLDSAEAARAAYRDMLASVAARLPGVAVEGVLVQEMARGRREIMLGLKQEPGLGPALVLGLGGIFAETLRDTATRLAPLSCFDAAEMVRELRARALFGAVRGLGAVPPTLIEELLLRLSGLALRHRDWIEELDVNPVIIGDDGATLTAVDVLVRAKDTTADGTRA